MEKGYLESMSKLLVWSIREFGGKFRDIPIYSYQPRKNLKISRKTISFFEKHDVHHIDLELNKDYTSYPLANKPLACAHRENNSNADILIFQDSDIFYLREPEKLIDFDGYDVILRPVDGKNIGVAYSTDINAPYWKNLYQLLDVKVERRVKPTGDDESILEYYNSGHLITKTKNSLFNQWKENFV